VKSLKCLVRCLLLDAGALCDVDVARDIETALARFEEEGIPFLTVTLPSYCAAFEEALRVGSISSVPFPNFRKRGGYPLFLGGMLRMVFNPEGGAVREDASADAVQAVRQVTSFLGKIFQVCSERYQKRSVEAYITCEKELESQQSISADYLDRLGNVAVRYFGSILTGVDQDLFRNELVPGHGPGSTADGMYGNQKYDLRGWSDNLEPLMPSADYLIPNSRHHAVLDDVQFFEPGTEPPVKVVLVPKTARKARVIAMEPSWKQYAQQALLRSFAERMAGDPVVDISDQSGNQLLAQLGSLDGSFATLDMSEASDRVTVEVVRAVFRRTPLLLQALLAVRSGTASLPCGDIIPLRKYASMGSAVCFPVQTIVFATVVLDAVEQAVNSSSRLDLSTRQIRACVRVFGDDIVVSTPFVHHAIDSLNQIGMRLNPHKSFWTGKFRESCGGDFFRGLDVTYAKLRQLPPRSRRDASGVLSLIAFRNHLYERGFWKTAGRIDDLVRHLGLPLPIVEKTSPVMGRYSCCFAWRGERIHPSYQSPLVKGVVVKTRSPKSESSDVGRLLKCLLPRRVEPFYDKEHLLRSGRPDRVRIKVGMGQPF
jgi:hypothetical protein